MRRVRNCPRCDRQSLIPTGAYWGCGPCGFAITHAALCLEMTETLRRSREVPSHAPVPAQPALSRQ